MTWVVPVLTLWGSISCRNPPKSTIMRTLSDLIKPQESISCGQDIDSAATYFLENFDSTVFKFDRCLPVSALRTHQGGRPALRLASYARRERLLSSLDPAQARAQEQSVHLASQPSRGNPCEGHERIAAFAGPGGHSDRLYASDPRRRRRSNPTAPCRAHPVGIARRVSQSSGDEQARRAARTLVPEHAEKTAG